MNEEPFAEEPRESCNATGEAMRELGDAAKRAFEAGKEDARKAAAEAGPRIQNELERGAHDLAYGVAYATTFAATMVKSLAPDAVTEGFTEGADGGKAAAERAADRMRRKPGSDESPASDSGDSLAPA